MNAQNDSHFFIQCLNFMLLLSLHTLDFCNCIIHPDGQSTVSRYQDLPLAEMVSDGSIWMPDSDSVFSRTNGAPIFLSGMIFMPTSALKRFSYKESGNYQFGYTVASNDGEHFHKAGTDPLGRVVGSYGMTLADGRSRLVDYVADKNGFRAHIRSNEPGIISAQAADAIIEKTDNPAFLAENQKLELASLSSRSDDTFGERLKHTASQVVYVRPNENEEHRREKDEKEYDDEEEEKEEINDDEDDGDLDKSVETIARREPLRTDDELSHEDSTSFEQGPRSRISDFGPPKEFPRVRLPDHDSEYFSEKNPQFSFSRGYNLPLDPSTAMRSPGFQGPLSSRNFYSARPTSLPEPSTPPYGGFDFKPSVFSSNFDFEKFPDNSQYHTSFPGPYSYNGDRVNRYPKTLTPLFTYDKDGKYPSVTMSTVHGGYTGYYPYNKAAEPEDEYGVPLNQYPGRRPHTTPTGTQPNYGRRITTSTRHPSVATGKPNLILRTVAIPNGIQAVPVDPTTGQVHNNREFRARDSRFDVKNDDRFHPQNKQKSFTDFPLVYEKPLALTPLPAKSPSHHPDSFKNPHHNNPQYRRPALKKPDESKLSKPSSKDLALISRVFEHVNSQHRHQSGITTDPYHFDSAAVQPDPHPDYPSREIIHNRPRGQSDVHKYDFEDDYKTYYKPDPKDFREDPVRVRRPSVAVRLPVSDRRPLNYGNSRGYRHALEDNSKEQKDELVSEDNDDKSHTS